MQLKIIKLDLILEFLFLAWKTMKLASFFFSKIMLYVMVHGLKLA